MALLELHAVTKYFGGLAAVKGIDLTLLRGQHQAIIGPNGAGKTTLLNLIMGRLQPTSGHIRFRGQEITGLSSHARARQGMAKTFQKPQLFAALTAFENVRAAVHVGHSGWRHTRSVQQETRDLLRRLDLADKARLLASELSHGDQKRLDLGMALGRRPALLLLDEPTAGLSHVETNQMIQLIQRLTETALILVEHDMKVVMALADAITVMHQGAVLARGTPDEIRANQQVQEVYLRTDPC
ncbi:Arginine transport ATP-binding protein ArtM [Candidatus Entotheonellaceae bacterium PAL068K]